MYIKNPNDPDHYLSPLECRKYMKKPSFKALKNEIPNPKLDSEEKKAIAFAKNWDKNHDFRATKVYASVICDSCGAL